MQVAVTLALRKQIANTERNWGHVGIGERVAATVENGALESHARRLGLNKFVRGTVGDRAGRVLANVFESLCGALYLEGGLPRVASVAKGLVDIERVDWTKELERELGLWTECKGGVKVARMGERVQGELNRVVVAFRVVDRKGLDTHQAFFTCQADAILHKRSGTGRANALGICIGRAEKKSKIEAQQAAAEVAVRSLRGEGFEAENAVRLLNESGWLSGRKITLGDSSGINEVRQTKIHCQNETMKSAQFQNDVEVPGMALAISDLRMNRLFENQWGALKESENELNETSERTTEIADQGNYVAWRRFLGRSLRKLWAAEQGYLSTGAMADANDIYVDCIQRRVISAMDVQNFRKLSKESPIGDKLLRNDTLEVEMIGWMYEKRGWPWTREFLHRMLKASLPEEIPSVQAVEP